MSAIKEGGPVDGDVKKTGAVPQIKPDRRIDPSNKPRPVGPQPKQ